MNSRRICIWDRGISRSAPAQLPEKEAMLNCPTHLPPRAPANPLIRILDTDGRFTR